MIRQDVMHVKIEEVGVRLLDGSNDTGRFSRTENIRCITIEFPSTGANGRLAEGSDLEAVFDHAIDRAETMVRNLKKMKSEHLAYEAEIRA